MRASFMAFVFAAIAAAATAPASAQALRRGLAVARFAGEGGQSTTPQPAPAAGQNVVSPPALGRVFAAEQGLIFNAIRPDKVMDFEIVIAKLRAALANSKDPVRNQQGWGWKIFKAAEPGPNGSVLYVFVMDPAVKGADYGVAKILAEAYPTEIMELYRMYAGAFSTAGQTLMNLQPVAAAPNASAPPTGPASASAPPTAPPKP